MAHKFVNANFTEIFDEMLIVSKSFESPIKIWIGPELVVFADNPEILQIVLNSQNCLDKSPHYDLMLLKKGLAIGKGELWRRHRKLLNPSFSISILQQIIPSFDEKSLIFVRNLEKEVNKKEFDVHGYVVACSMETMLKGVLEVERDIQSEPFDNEYLHDVEV
jgi:cytochrome P450